MTARPRFPEWRSSAKRLSVAIKTAAAYLLPLVLAVLLALVLAAVSAKLHLRWSSSVLALVFALLALTAHLLSERALSRGCLAAGGCGVLPKGRLAWLLLGVAATGACLSAANAAGGCLAVPSHWECVRLVGPTELTLIGVLCAPLFEEVLLRGYLRRSLLRVGLSEFPVGLVTALLFAYVHAKHWDDASTAVYFSVSLLLSSLAYAMDGILLSVIFHAGWNVLAVLVVGSGLSYAAGPLQQFTVGMWVKVTVALVLMLLCWINYRCGRTLVGRVINAEYEGGAWRPRR